MKVVVENMAQGAARVAPHSSSLKSILVHIAGTQTLPQRIEAALSIARANSAHVRCVHVTPPEAYVAMDSFGGVFAMPKAMKLLDEQEAQIRSLVERELQAEDVSWDFVQATGNVASQIARFAALAELVVVGREPRGRWFDDSHVSALGNLLYRLRTPLFIPVGNGALDPNGVALIAWNGSYEAANAVRTSLGLLRLASQVHIYQVKEPHDPAFPSTELGEFLSRHDIHAHLEVEQVHTGGDGPYLATLLMARAQALGASYLVMGGYSHSRAGEFLVGGVTRTLLEKSSLPLVIAH